jgi:hypothetical protein
MPNYLLVYHGGGMPETPEEQAAAMAAWGAWFDAVAKAKGSPVPTSGGSVEVEEILPVM